MEPFIITGTCFVQAEKSETPGRLCLAVDTRNQTSHGHCVIGRRRGPRMLEDTGASPPLTWMFQRLAAQAELRWWLVPSFGVFEMRIPAPGVEKWAWNAPSLLGWYSGSCYILAQWLLEGAARNWERKDPAESSQHAPGKKELPREWDMQPAGSQLKGV